MKTLTSRCAGLIIALVALHGLTGCGTYNRLVALEQNVNKKWADVQSVYQRRADYGAGRGQFRKIDAN